MFSRRANLPSGIARALARGLRLGVVMMLAGTVFTFGANATWTANSNGNWTTNSNWSAAHPQSLGDVATFANVLTATRTVTLDASRSIGALVFNANTFGYTLSGPNILTLNNPIGLTQNGSAAVNIGVSSLRFASNQTWTGNGTGLVTVSSPISETGGARSLTKNGSFALALSGANTFTGGTTINGGTVYLDHRQGLGTGSVTLSNNALLRLDFGSWFSTQTATFGDVTINDGTIQRNGAFLSSAILNGSLTVNGTAVLQNTTSIWSDLSINGAVQVNSGATLTANVNGGNTITFGGSGANLTLAAGSTFATTGGGAVAFGSGAARTIVGQGTTSQEAVLRLGAGSHSYTGNSFQVDGSGRGGLRIEGTQANVDSLATDARLAATTGSGGTLTIAYTDAGNRDIGSAANLAAPANVSLGLVSNGGTFTLGTAGGPTGDLGNWAGLIVGGSNTTVGFADNNVFSSTADLTLFGGLLALNGTTQTFDSLTVLGNSVIDFGTLASTLNVNSLSIAAGITLTIANWTDAVDFFFSQIDPGAAALSQIAFSPYPASATHWQSWDKQITPVPEPSTYGLLLSAFGIACYLWRRRCSRSASA